MSDVLYPISMISKMAVTRRERTLLDEFEAGNVQARRLWAEKSFKRQFEVQHAPLTLEELRRLNAFHAQRSGMADSFWFRDNISRGGNAKVRFADAHGFAQQAGERAVRVRLDEVDVTRALVDADEVETAAGAAPVLWWDANREAFYSHNGTMNYESQTWDASFAARYRANWSATPTFNGTASQWQAYDLAASAKTAANVTEITAGDPACTIFAVVKNPVCTSKKILFAVGTQGAGNCLGLALAADNRYEPWVGGSETYTNARFQNSAAATWRTISLMHTASSNAIALRVNAATVGTDSPTKTLVVGPANLGAAQDGTLACASGDLVAHVLLFAASLTNAQITALHNLFAHQYGYATV